MYGSLIWLALLSAPASQETRPAGPRGWAVPSACTSFSRTGPESPPIVFLCPDTRAGDSAPGLASAVPLRDLP